MNSVRGSSSLRFYTAPPSALSVPCCAYSTDCLKQQRRAAAHHVGHKGRKTRELGPTGRMQNVAAHSAATCAFAERCWLRLLVTGGRHCCCQCCCQCCCCCLSYTVAVVSLVCVLVNGLWSIQSVVKLIAAHYICNNSVC